MAVVVVLLKISPLEKILKVTCIAFFICLPGALLVGTMNLAWGTGCHVTNLVRLRHVSGMSGLTLFLHLVGSSLHCILWAFVLICYIGFLDESRQPAGDEDGSSSGSATSKRKLGDGLPRI